MKTNPAWLLQLPVRSALKEAAYLEARLCVDLRGLLMCPSMPSSSFCTASATCSNSSLLLASRLVPSRPSLLPTCATEQAAPECLRHAEAKQKGVR